jgi:3'(2'), 5'-bisphosphate nucleotidase
MPYERELNAALQAARLAGEYILREYEAFEVIPDAPADISTEVDRRSQDLILEHLVSHFPDDGYRAEEATPTLKALTADRERLWVIDPIDGTRGFARKNGEFSVMIGFMEGDVTVLGVVLEPVGGVMTYAVRGEGCWQVRGSAAQPVRSTVSACASLAEARLITSHVRPGSSLASIVKALQPREHVESYSAGVKLARVARGEVDVYVNDYPAFRDWDICAGHILVEEAGGCVTEMRGVPVRYRREGAWQRGGLVAGTREVQAQTIQRLQLIV